jgi:hypothetical protein
VFSVVQFAKDVSQVNPIGKQVVLGNVGRKKELGKGRRFANPKRYTQQTSWTHAPLVGA